MEFNWKDFKNHKCVVCCKTEEEAKEFIHECYKHGISWIHSCENETNWNWCEKDTYYNCDVELHLSYGNINNGLIVDLPVVEYKEDNKMELKEGMIIECRNGERYLLRKFGDDLIGSNNTKYIYIHYDEELNENKYYQEDSDIMKIYESNAHVLGNLFNNDYLECIWERKGLMSDYKFKVGDKVKVESLDFWSVENMKNDIGKIGKIVFKEKDKSKKCNAYLIQYDDENYLDEHDGWWFAEDSLNFIEE